MAKFHLSNKAVDDLDSIWLYTLDTWSETQADLYYHELLKTCQAIANRPIYLDREFKEIIDASARSLNIKKIARTIEDKKA